MKLFRVLRQGRTISTLLPVVSLLAAVPALRAEGPGVYALKDARVVRVSGPVLEHGTVVVRDGLIQAVGENVTVPADAWVIDCKGLTVYPGLIDAFSTIGIPGAAGVANAARRPATPTSPQQAAVMAAVASEPVARGPEDRPSNQSYVKAVDQISPNDSRIESARNGGVLTAVTFPVGQIFNGNGSVINLNGGKPGQMVVAEAVGQSIAIRSQPYGMSRSFPGSLMGYIAYVRQMYLDADHYKLAKAIYEKHPQGLPRPAYDRTLEGIISSPRILLPAIRGVEIERMVAFAKELKQPVVLYGAHEGFRVVDFVKQANVPVLISLKWPARIPDGDPANIESLKVLETREKAPSTPGLFAKAGVRFAFYSDGLATPREMLTAVKKSIDAGLAPADAIRALTLTPAEIYGVSDRLGSIDQGKIANLVVSDGDLFTASTKVKYVFVDGAKFEVPPDAAPAGRGGQGTRGSSPTEGDQQ